MDAIKPFFQYFSVPAILLLAVEFFICLVFFIRSLRQPGDTRRMMVLGMVLQLLSVVIILQNIFLIPRLLPDVLHRYLALLPFIVAGLYFALMREVQLHKKKCAPIHYALGGAASLCTLVSYLAV